MKNLPPIIAFCGQATAGKTSAAIVVCSYTDAAVRYSFADPIRDMLKAGFGLTDIDLLDHKDVPFARLFGKTPRELMQSLGTEWGRDRVHREIWTELAMQRVGQVTNQGFTAVFDDCRFDNEAQAIRNNGGIVVRIDRPDLPPPMEHASERGVAPHLINYTIMAADLLELRTKVTSLLNTLSE